MNRRMPNQLNLLPREGEAYLCPHFLAPAEADQLLTELTSQTHWRQEPIKVYGRLVMQPRLTAWYGDTTKPIHYSGITMQPLAWSAPLARLKARAEAVTGARFTNALLNLYRDGRDAMGWHRDNELELGPEPLIASVSLGAVRPFHIRLYRDKATKLSVELAHGSLLVMAGAMQQAWEHSLPRRLRLKEPRINITFRTMLF